MTFAPPEALIDGKLMIDTLRHVRPSEFVAVPRVYEKFKEMIETKIRESSSVVKWLYEHARAIGYGNTVAQMEDERAPFGYSFAKITILSRIKKELGLDRVERAYFGAAPMSGETKKFFMSLGLPLMNVYGLSETSGAATYMDPPDITLEKSGRALPGTQIKIFNPDEQGNGEICIRGRNVFMGYLNNPEATFEVMDSEGYFHTGDIGCIDPKTGFLDITGRIKELIVTAGGENVSPIPIEVALMEACPIISHAIVIGDERKYLTALLTLKGVLEKNGRESKTS